MNLKIVLIVLMVAIIVLGGGAMIAGPKLMKAMSSLTPEPARTEVRIQELRPQTLVEVVSAPGEIEPFAKVDISAEVSARIVGLPFREGDEVRKGDVIVQLDDRDLQAALDSTKARRDAEQFRLQSEEARLTGSVSNLSFSRKELQRMQSLYGSGDVSRKSLDDAEQRVEDLDASIEAATHTISVIRSSLAASEADIARAEDGLNNTIVVAPMTGVITELNMEVGEQVLGTFNNIGSRIMTIADLTRMILTADVAESDIAAVREGQPAKIHINAYPDIVFEGTTTQIALQRTLSSEGAGVFKTEVEFDLQGRTIRSGHAANVDIEVARHRGLVVESQAIVERLVEDLPSEIRRNNPLVDHAKRTTEVVYRVVDGKAVCTPVKSGPSDLTHTLVLEGLNEAEVVIVGPYKVLEKIEDGELIRDEAKAAADVNDSPDDSHETQGRPEESQRE
ncbi:MAG: efflux RND transporter periplasmic adaptor subunit [Phycisphaerales bacterium]